MKPVIVQNLIRNMRKNAKLPMPTINDAPSRKDKSGTFVIAAVVIVIIAVFFI